MESHVRELLRMNRSVALAGVIKDRWKITPTAELLQWLHEIQFRRSTPPVGGTQESPWSDSTWLLWIKKRTDEFSANPTLASDPANRYGPPFEVELEPANVAAWRSFLARYSEEGLAWEELSGWSVHIPQDVTEARWMGFAPADESAMQAAESRLGRRLPPSLRCFYSVSNGWRGLGASNRCYGVLPVEEVGWLRDRDLCVNEWALRAELEPGRFVHDPGNQGLDEYRYEQGTRVRRSLVTSFLGVVWLLDPGALPHQGEWPGGYWSLSRPYGPGPPVMSWTATNFAELLAEKLRHQFSR
jgi:hypothetical protein